MDTHAESHSYSTGEVTATSTKIDFAFVLSEVEHLVLACVARWDHPYATHAQVRLVVSRSPDDYLK